MARTRIAGARGRGEGNRPLSQTSSALQLVVPTVFQHATVATRHNALTSGHLGVNKTVGLLALDYYWNALRRDVERHVRICDTCQRQKATRHFRHGAQHNLTYIAVWECVSIDVVGPFVGVGVAVPIGIQVEPGREAIAVRVGITGFVQQSFGLFHVV